MELEAEHQQVAETPAALRTAPNVNPGSEWDEAFLRVESYLRAHGMESPVVLNNTAADIVREARERSQNGSPGEPVALAMDVTHSRIGSWFAQSGWPIDWKNERMRAQGRLALIIADLPGRWAQCFLSADPVPAEFAESMASFQILPGPEMRLSNMAPEPLEFSLLDPGDPRLRSRRIWIPVRAGVSWLLISGLFGVAWAATH
jgi:hypothetical protein